MKILFLLLSFVTQFRVSATGPDGKFVDYKVNQAIPTDNYMCFVDTSRDDSHALVSVSCKDKAAKEIVNVVAVCYTNEEDKNIAAFKFDGKYFMLGCKTTRGPEVL